MTIVCVERTIRTDLEHCSADKNYSLKHTEHITEYITEYSDSRVTAVKTDLMMGRSDAGHDLPAFLKMCFKSWIIEDVHSRISRADPKPAPGSWPLVPKHQVMTTGVRTRVGELGEEWVFQGWMRQ